MLMPVSLISVSFLSRRGDPLWLVNGSFSGLQFGVYLFVSFLIQPIRSTVLCSGRLKWERRKKGPLGT